MVLVGIHEDLNMEIIKFMKYELERLFKKVLQKENIILNILVLKTI